MLCLIDDLQILEAALAASHSHSRRLRPTSGPIDYMPEVFRKQCITDVTAIMISPVARADCLSLTVTCELVMQQRDRKVVDKAWLPFYGSREELVIIASQALRIAIANGGQKVRAAWIDQLAAFRDAEGETVLVLP